MRNDESSFVDFVHIVRRRKWIVALVVVVTPIVAYWHAQRQPALYTATSQVLLNPVNPALAYAGGGNSGSSAADPVRYAATQIFLARAPNVVEKVVRRAHIPGLTVGTVLATTSIYAPTDTNLLAFSATRQNPFMAQRLANLYADAYTSYRREVDSRGVQSAIEQVEKSLDATPASDTTLRTQLSDKLQTLRTTNALQRQSTYVARPAGPGAQVAPHPKRDAILGLGLGLVLGIGLAFLRDTLDTRIRTTEEIGERLGVPLVGHLPLLDRRAREENVIVMLDEPYGASAEMFRMLRTSIDLANLDRHARTLMVTSATEGEGKTTTAANLATAFAAAGRSVVLVDLDLRRPAVHGFLRLSSRPGVTDVALGQATLDDALQPVLLEELHSGGSLSVLPSGPMPPSPGEFAGSSAVGEILDELRERADLVIVDTPPVLQVAEAMTLSSRIDALLLVIRLSSVRRRHLDALRRNLERSPAKKLGFVAIGGDDASVTKYEHYAPFSYPVDDLVS
ncbi:MAG TPA: polysaccharide biosynthesis tyrosine autokinase [Gaiellaceae bacterium]|nr:polysaccharide biosynthesis tyrosine autokinase [Gaiellaceae bacterium]